MATIQTIRDTARKSVGEFISEAISRGVQTMQGETARAPMGSDPSVVLKTEINHGRWIVACPFCRPGGCMADPADERFYCLECNNRQAGYQWVAVEFPPERETIEFLLCLRPDVSNRNWKSGETVASLFQENVDNGLLPAMKVG